MKKIFSTIATLLLTSNTVFACGPFYEPRYRSIPYIDSQQSGGANYAFMLKDYQLALEPRQYRDDREYMADYFQSVRDLIVGSGRPIYVNLKASDLQDSMCVGNTKEAVNQIRDRFQGTDLGKLAHTQGGGTLFNAIQMVNSETVNACGVFTDFANTENHMQAALNQLEDFAGPSPLQDFIWLILARIHTYQVNDVQAARYITKINGSEVAWIQAYTKELQDIGQHLKQHKMPLNLILGSGRYYHRYGYGFGSGCGSNSVDTSLEYFKNLLASSISDAQAMSLMQARDVLLGNACVNMSEESHIDFQSLIQVDSSQHAASEFAKYLEAAYHFYQQSYDQALNLFELLRQAQNPWLAETSSYLVGRTLLIKAQKNWNGYSLPGEVIDMDGVVAADTAFTTYTQRYPGGIYEQSIEGLKRRMAYFKGDDAQINLFLDAAVNEASEKLQGTKNQHNTIAFKSMFQEWRKYSDRSVDYSTAPFLMIAYDVMHAQQDYVQKLKGLKSQHDKFTDQQSLYQLLETMLLYQLGRYQDIVINQKYDLDTQVGIGLAAFQAKTAFNNKNFQQARSIWVDLHEYSDKHQQWEAPRTEIAATYLAQKSFLEMAKQGTHIDSSKIFLDAFLNVCDLSELVMIANDTQAHPNARAAARYEAFSRAIHANDFKKLHQLFSQIKEPGEFSAIQTAARMLADNKDDAKGLMNLGYFTLVSMGPPIDDFEIKSTLLPDAESLSKCPTSYFRKQVYGPLEYFGRVVAQHDDTVRSQDEAKALHHIVMCEKPGQRGEACLWGHQDVSLLTGKQAFKRLHKKYADSEWAEKTPYYYQD
ncbi:hypothetical protein [Marinicella sp. W31]|uniref:hypothetical protein n=1 Tax=Marinicella sp. W31 TaxID=3023713 RepID=UPI003756E702